MGDVSPPEVCAVEPVEVIGRGDRWELGSLIVVELGSLVEEADSAVHKDMDELGILVGPK